MSSIRISHPSKRINARISIPGSKSESNRLLILKALSGNKLTIENLSTARDTQNLIRILASDEVRTDVQDAGTSMRFLTACFCIFNKHKIITGSERMCERPVRPLVEALIELGFDIHYLGKEGYPPIEIVPVDLDKIKSEVTIAGNISSQFITALLLIAPFLNQGLRITFSTEVSSRPYIDMTLDILKQLGVGFKQDKESIEVYRTSISRTSLSVQPDWSSASYWYSIAFLADEAEIFLAGLADNWTQGDRVTADWMKYFGVQTEFKKDGALIKKVSTNYPKMMKLDFRDNPDLAQTFAVMFSAANVYTTFTGIESLKIKETDRVAALQCELQKLNVNFNYSAMYDFYQMKGEFKFPTAQIQTYNDHRMAMSFAPLALMEEIEIEDPDVVEKSYPEFWFDMEKAGFKISLTR